MVQVDELTQTVLKGHLLVERTLDSILDVVLFHPDHLETARLSFNQKLQIARSLALRKDQLSIWSLVSSINSLRNELAHNLAGEKRQRKVEILKRVYLEEAGPKLGVEQQGQPDHIIAAHACALCIGFLATLEEDLANMRNYVDALDAKLNPDLERVRRQK